MRASLTKSYGRNLARLALLSLAGLTLPASALQPLITDDTGTQGSGGNQLEVSFSQERAKAAGDTERLRTLPVVYTRGVSETIDVFAALSYARVRTSDPVDGASGMANPSLGAKWRFFENEASKTSLALKPEILFPVSAERERSGLGSGKFSGNLTFIATQELPFGALHLNARIGRDRFRDSLMNPDTTTRRASIAPVWDVTEQWKLAIDLGVESARADGNSVRTKFAEIGAVYSPGKDVDFAVGIVRVSDNDSPHTTTHTATAGMTWRFQ